jgi:hypothetical protein
MVFIGAGRLGRTHAKRSAMESAVRANDFAGLHDLLKGAQIIGNLLLWFFAKKPGNGGAELAARWIVLEFNGDHSTAVSGRPLEADRASIGYIGAFKRTPRNLLVGLIVYNLSIPLDAHAGRSFGLPV